MHKLNAIFVFAIAVVPQLADAEETSLRPLVSAPSLSYEAARVEEYWTEERMRQATETPLPAVSVEEMARIMTHRMHTDDGEAKTIEPSDSGVDHRSRGNPYAARGEVVGADVSKRPFWNGGKFFYTTSDGSDFYCSAAFVGHRRVVMTAAHCLVDSKTGEFYQNLKFRQGYNNGGGTSFSFDTIYVWSDWITGTSDVNFFRDYGFLVTKSDSAEGWLGLKTHVPYQLWYSIGYPRNYGGGNYMQVVSGQIGRISAGIVEMQGNPMKQGASGGPWIGEPTTDHIGGNYAIGLNSHIYQVYPTSQFGPYFDHRTFELFQAAKGNMQ